MEGSKEITEENASGFTETSDALNKKEEIESVGYVIRTVDGLENVNKTEANDEINDGNNESSDFVELNTIELEKNLYFSDIHPTFEQIGLNDNLTESEKDSPFYVVSQETIDESHRLYRYHFKREVMLKNLTIPEYIFMGSCPINMNNLITLADQFRSSPQRQWVYEQAETVQLESLNFHTFRDLLGGLFQEGGVTWERVLVLFFFCTDLSIRAFRENLYDFFYSIHDWTSSYIANSLSYWVEQQGGWNVVLRQSVNQATRVAFFTLCCFGVLALAIYIRSSRNV